MAYVQAAAAYLYKTSKVSPSNLSNLRCKKFKFELGQKTIGLTWKGYKKTLALFQLRFSSI